ncbi:hypothetical protein [Corynebacterium rouxii]|uniref:hypothetical protein n=1 Tax=Corynebacterium rouxii TaxID=2719119 RepID=UPI001E4AB7C9|nr:hypothetical protein [Corynebacterium rouxii]
MYVSGEYTQADIAALMNVSDWTVRRILKASPAWHQFRDSHTWLCDRDTHQKLLCMLWLRFALRRTCCSLRYWGGLGHVYGHWGSTRVAGILMILRVANLRR